jgi:4-oxalomesaconate tautomerase
MQTKIRCMLMRGGTSKGAYFLASDLPSDIPTRDAVLLAVMGSPDTRQIDGVGGAHPLTSKVAIVERSKRPDADIDFLFAQVTVDKALVDTTPNCGNILAGIGGFAIERGLIKPRDGVTPVRVYQINTETIAELLVPTPGGEVQYDGDERIDGVPGMAAAIPINFLDVAGSVCGSLLPTGNVVDVIDGVPVTLIDNGMPVMVMRADSVGCTGYEPHAQLNADKELKARLNAIRLKAGPMMNLGEVSGAVIPKIALLAPPVAGGVVCSRSFIPHEAHSAVGVFAAVSIATACILPGTPVHDLAAIPPGRVKQMSVEHPTGEFTVRMEVGGTEEAPVVEKAGLVRTARALFDGYVMIPQRVWQPARVAAAAE